VCRDAGVQLVLAGLTPRIASTLVAGGFDVKAPNVRRFADLDHGLEWAEEMILGANDTPQSLGDVLDTALTRVGTRMLMELGEHRRVAAGGLLLRQGEPSNELIFVISGRVQVLLRLGSQNLEESKRLRTYGPGSVVGEMGFFSGEQRSADVVAEVDSEVLCITHECNARIENQHPELARAIHRHVINTLAQRLRSANDEIRLLL
jgi:sulfate permease, SulP family